MKDKSRFSRIGIGGLMFLGLFALLATMSVLKYYSLHSTIADLGVYFNFFANIQWGEWKRLLSAHTLPLIPIWALIYGTGPLDMGASLVLIAQAAALTWPVAVIYHRFGILPALAFLLYFPLWYNALFDFHIDHLAVSFLFGFFFLKKGAGFGPQYF
ncbi:MAG: hypothetical protein ACE5EK_06715 [Nitrospinales bacterium]